MGKVAGGAGRGASRRAVTGGGTGGMDPAERERLAQVAIGILQGAPVALPQPPRQTANLLGESSVDSYGGDSIYEFSTASGNRVRMDISQYGDEATITFKVNESYKRSGEVPQEEANAISLRLMRHIREDIRTRPNGFKYSASAATGDMFGAQRAVAYTAVGLSRPQNATPGRTQYGVIQNGKLRPDLERLRQSEGDSFSAYNRLWAEDMGDFRQARRSR